MMLQACNTFKMFNGKAAEAEFKTLAELSGGSHLENDLIRHNLVVFRGGDNALQVRHTLVVFREGSGLRAGEAQSSCFPGGRRDKAPQVRNNLVIFRDRGVRCCR